MEKDKYIGRLITFESATNEDIGKFDIFRIVGVDDLAFQLEVVSVKYCSLYSVGSNVNIPIVSMGVFTFVDGFEDMPLYLDLCKRYGDVYSIIDNSILYYMVKGCFFKYRTLRDIDTYHEDIVGIEKKLEDENFYGDTFVTYGYRLDSGEVLYVNSCMPRDIFSLFISYVTRLDECLNIVLDYHYSSLVDSCEDAIMVETPSYMGVLLESANSDKLYTIFGIGHIDFAKCKYRDEDSNKDSTEIKLIIVFLLILVILAGVIYFT